jgi:N6-adenosine-specific RNA methylase IME4
LPVARPLPVTLFLGKQRHGRLLHAFPTKTEPRFFSRHQKSPRTSKLDRANGAFWRCDMQPPNALLFQNPDRHVSLIDIPASIAIAQGRSDTLLSTAPLHVPYALHEEPKTAHARKNNASHLTQLHIEYRSLIHAALAEIRSRVAGPWCLPRKLTPQTPGPDQMLPDMHKEIEARLQEWSALNETKREHVQFDFQQMMASLGATPGPDPVAHEIVAHKWLLSHRLPCDAVPTSPTTEATEPWTSSFHNPRDHPLDLRVRENAAQPGCQVPEYRFTVPPGATFVLSDLSHPNVSRAFRELTDDYVLPRHFDLVLLDPPWPNRSARRKGAYEMAGGMPHIKKMLLKMDIDNYFEHNALVGVWVTNKEAMRTQVLGPGGLFEAWNVGLVEEWIWAKVTTQGEPMFDIDSSLRKPYEVLLLGRAAPNAWTKMEHLRQPTKKVIAAVPDVHSRKPCLKELLEPYMPDANDYSALEVFSRNLVTGWTSWGNEAIKFNWERYWTSETDS